MSFGKTILVTLSVLKSKYKLYIIKTTTALDRARIRYNDRAPHKLIMEDSWLGGNLPLYLMHYYAKVDSSISDYLMSVAYCPSTTSPISGSWAAQVSSGTPPACHERVSTNVPWTAGWVTISLLPSLCVFRNDVSSAKYTASSMSDLWRLGDDGGVTSFRPRRAEVSSPAAVLVAPM